MFLVRKEVTRQIRQIIRKQCNRVSDGGRTGSPVMRITLVRTGLDPSLVSGELMMQWEKIVSNFINP